jgi:hypothetical protein
MRHIRAKIRSVSPMAQGRYHQTPKLNDRELADDYEKRTWRERLHVTNGGNILIPPGALKNCLSDAAKFLSLQIPGKGKSTYTKHFEAGILVVEGIELKTKKDEAEGLWLHVPPDGRRGGSKRVLKCFPVVREWSGDAVFYVLDDTITKPVFDQHLEAAGKFIGLGSLRVRNNGWFGRFEVVKTEEIRG